MYLRRILADSVLFITTISHGERSFPMGRFKIRPTLAFYPNRLGRLPANVSDKFVTMNPVKEPRPVTIAAEAYLVHPVAVGGIDREKARASRENIQGERTTWWADSYMRTRYVHESALESGRDAASKLLESTAKNSAMEHYIYAGIIQRTFSNDNYPSIEGQNATTSIYFPRPRGLTDEKGWGC